MKYINYGDRWDTKYVIQDWTGARITRREFNTFEDAWYYILGELTDLLGLEEDDYQEYYVKRI